MSKEDFVELTTNFVFDVQQSVGFDTDAAHAVLAKLRTALEPMQVQCLAARDAVADLERQIARQLAHHPTNRTKFLCFDRMASGYMGVSDFHRALEGLNIDAMPATVALLVQKYDTRGEGRINYTSFLRLVHSAANARPPTSEAHDAQPFFAPHNAALAADDDDDLTQSERWRTEQLIARIRAKLYQRGMSVRQLFLDLDQGRYSHLTLQELHRGLVCCGIDIHVAELAHLTRHFAQRDDLFSLVDFARLVDAVDDSAIRPSADGAPHPLPPPRPPAPPSRTCTAAPPSSDVDMAVATALHAQGKTVRALFDTMAPRGALAPAALQRKLHQWGIYIDDADVIKLVGAYDTNGNGTLELHEFVRFMHACRRNHESAYTSS
ncbi:Aste57867_15215 [Aphanomyces stellatus]|uniref:Aste57867_15215 protein n=1 Tax=Aphanomyces stellatus TaxID=120398 RepID=A0A485L3L1_9STRA|nr:hypothetical protein As57867_015159 [Aphanomyces stellatus]VFT92024.1 Aste57867_15215 [Aphanomyces stellatus]